MKERIYQIMIIILSVMLFSVWQVYAGTPTGPGTPPASTYSYTLEDIYNRLNDGTAGSESTFSEPTGAPSTGTMHTLNEIMALAPMTDTNGATTSDVVSDKTFWGLTEGQWALQTGAGVPESPCTDKHAQGDATAEAYPWQGSLQQMIDGQWQHTCGAVLYTNNKALTTASCIDGLSASDLRVVFGEHDLDQSDGTEQISALSSMTAHPSYDSAADGQPNDIAVLRLSSTMNLSSSAVGVITLASGSNDFAGAAATLTGWGQTYAGGTVDNNILQHESSTVLTNADCTTQYSSVSGTAIDSGHICIYESEPIDTCTGDLGGPIVSGNTLVGLQSWEVLEDPNLPRVGTRISDFNSWIQGQ